MRSRNLLLLAVLFFFQFVRAQQLMEISGKVVAQGTEEALPFANIAAYAPNDSLTSGTLSDEKGRFSFKCDCSDGCYFVISYLGMEPQRITAMKWQGTWRNLGKIALSPSATMLNAVTVADTMAIIDHRFDRTVVKIEATRKATAHSIYDILRSLPGLAVDANGGMVYNGLAPSVYVDNSPADLLYPDLESIPIDRIEKVELIDAAVQKGGEGRGGIINIKLRAADEGLSGSLAVKPSTYNFKELNNSENSLNLNYKRKKLIWIANSSFSTTDRSWGYTMQKDFRQTENPVIVKEERSDDNSYRVSGNSIGFIYKPNDYTNLTVSGSYSYSASIMTAEQNTQERHGETNELISQINSLGKDRRRSTPNYGIGTNFYREFQNSSNHYINSAAYVSFYQDRLYGNRLEKFSYHNGLVSDSIYKEQYDSRSSMAPTVYANIYYNNPLSDNLNLSVNYNIDATFNRNASVEFFSNEEPVLPKNQGQHYHSVYNYLSSNLTYFTGKWRFTGGLSFEDKILDGQFDYYDESAGCNAIQIVDKNYFRVIPSATVRYSFNWQNSLSLTLANTWEYPYFERLQDFIDKSTNYNWLTGNSNLKPSPNYSAYLKYELFKNTWSFMPSLFVKYQDHLISNIPIPINQLTKLLYPANIAQQSKIGFDLSTGFSIKNLSINLYSSFYYTQFRICEGQTYGDIDLSEAYTNNHDINGYAYCMATYKIKSVNLSSQLQYWNTGLSFNGYSNDYFTLSINASRNFFKNKLLVNLGVSNLLKGLSPNTSHSENLGVITDTELFGYYNQPMFNLSLRYNFRYGSRNTENVQGMRYF